MNNIQEEQKDEWSHRLNEVNIIIRLLVEYSTYKGTLYQRIYTKQCESDKVNPPQPTSHPGIGRQIQIKCEL